MPVSGHSEAADRAAYRIAVRVADNSDSIGESMKGYATGSRTEIIAGIPLRVSEFPPRIRP